MDKRIECVIVGPIATNCWLYPLNDEPQDKQPCVVIDPGDEASKIISSLKKLNWVPRYVFLTHGHWDHITALPELLEAFKKGTFDNEEPPKIYMHKMDAHHLKNNTLPLHHIEDGDTIGPFKVLHTPGHTPGSVCFYDETGGHLFTGDTLFHGDHGRTDLPGGSEEQIRQSLKRLLSLNSEAVVYPGHEETTTVAEEKHQG
jgi:glyoxylase-like metal-dependent hydrolase (beta-lactamase superfamily II)